MPAGRPKKYNEKRIMISLFLPEFIVEELDSLAKQKNTTRTELIHSYLLTTDKEEALRLLEAYQEMSEHLKLMAETNKSQNDILNKLKGKTMMQLYADFESDENIKQIVNEYFNEFKELIIDAKKRGLSENTIAEGYSEKLFNILEQKLINEKKIIKNEKVVKKIIKNELLRLLYGNR